MIMQMKQQQVEHAPIIGKDGDIVLIHKPIIGKDGVTLERPIIVEGSEVHAVPGGIDLRVKCIVDPDGEGGPIIECPGDIKPGDIKLGDITFDHTRPIIVKDGGIELAHWSCSAFIKTDGGGIEVGIKCGEAEETDPLTDETLGDSYLQQMDMDTEYNDYSYSLLVRQETVIDCSSGSCEVDDLPLA